MLKTSARLLELLSLLQLRQEWTGRELADRLGVEPRTIRRDVSNLRTLGYPVAASAGAAGGYRLVAGPALPPLMLDESEAVAVAVGLRSAAAGSIVGIEATSLEALTKLERVLPPRLRQRVRTLVEATSSIDVDSPPIDAEVLVTLAGACRHRQRARFTYLSAADQTTLRDVEPNAVVHSGYRWYLVAYDRGRDDWRTFRIDRIRGRVSAGAAMPAREVPGGNPAAYVQRMLGPHEPRRDGSSAGRIRLRAPISQLARRVPRRLATVEPDGDDACIVTTRGGWSRRFLIDMTLLDLPMEVLGPPELAEAARVIWSRLTPDPAI